jgi:hypothetical protein
MGSLAGKILNLVSDPMSRVRATLVPLTEAVTSGGEVRIGSVRLDLGADDGAFLVTDVPDGVYVVHLRVYDPPSGQMRTVVTAAFPIEGETFLDVALGLALLTGPQTLVVKLDTDGQPYFVTDGSGDYAIFIDDDGQPYFDDPPGGEDVYFDVDGAPVILTLT